MAEKKRLERRKSALSGDSPVAPAPQRPAAPPAAAPAAAPTPAGDQANGESAEKKKWPSKTSFYQSPEDGARMRAAFVNTMVPEGLGSLSEFIARAVAREVERLEAQYNEGKPWPAVQPRQVPKGPPRHWSA